MFWPGHHSEGAANTCPSMARTACAGQCNGLAQQITLDGLKQHTSDIMNQNDFQFVEIK